jgi:hypothetical protein
VVYRYYSCGSFIKKGRTACPGRSMRVEKLDALVTEHLTSRIFDPDHLASLLGSLAYGATIWMRTARQSG